MTDDSKTPRAPGAPPPVPPRAAPPPPPTAAFRPASTTPAVGVAPAAGATNEASKGSLLSPSSTKAMIDIAATAKRLRDEQIEAKVVYYGQEQRTNKDLDAITEAVVAELQSLQLAGVRVVVKQDEPTIDVSIELIGTLRALLEKLFSTRREGFMRRKLEDIQRKITSLFFNSALYNKITTQARQALSVSYPDQALYIALRSNRDSIIAALKAQKYAEPGIAAEAASRYEAIEKELRMEFLSRTTPELEALLKIYREVLLKFFFEDFKPSLGEFCWQVIKQSRVGEGRHAGYKLGPDMFSRFREVFENHFLERLVLNVQGPIVQRSESMRDTFREETLHFVADPQIFSDICTVVCDAIYDYLYSEGFLDLPTQWRNHLFHERGLNQ